MESKLQLVLDKNKEIIEKFEEHNKIMDRLRIRPSFLEPLLVKKSVSVSVSCPQLSELVKKDSNLPNDWVVVNNNLKKK